MNTHATDAGANAPRDAEPSRVVVIGSANVDYIARVARRPAVGETVAGEDFTVLPGGKGANQAVAAARSGGHVSFIGALGDDVHGSMMLDALTADGINVEGVARHPCASGNAIIVVDAAGDNTIIITPGANAMVTPQTLHAQRDLLHGASVCVLQGELSPEATEAAAICASQAGARVVINLAPIIEVSPETLALADPLVVNSHEAAQLLGRSVDSIETEPDVAARELWARGPRSVVVTLGSHGLALIEADDVLRIAAFPVEAIDTTGAGDGFVGALAESLARGQSLPDASRYASGFAALAVTRRGAQASYPTRAEAEQFLS